MIILLNFGTTRHHQSTYLCVDLVDDPLEPLPAPAGVEADVLRQHFLHVPIEWNDFYADRRLLPEKRLGGICRVRSILENLVHREEAVERHVGRLQSHLTVVEIHRRPLVGKFRQCNSCNVFRDSHHKLAGLLILPCHNLYCTTQ